MDHHEGLSDQRGACTARATRLCGRRGQGRDPTLTALAGIAQKRTSSLPEYRPGQAVAGSAVGKLSSNESVLGPGPLVLEAIREAALTVGAYPNDRPLQERLAEQL